MSADAKKVVVKLDLDDEKAKKKAMQKVSGLRGIDSLAMDMKGKKLTVIGDVDPAAVVCKLRKCWCAEILSVGPAKEEKPQQPKNPEKPKKQPKQPEKPKEEVALTKQLIELLKACQDHKSRATMYHCIHCAEESPNPCVMC